MKTIFLMKAQMRHTLYEATLLMLNFTVSIMHILHRDIMSISPEQRY